VTTATFIRRLPIDRPHPLGIVPDARLYRLSWPFAAPECSYVVVSAAGGETMVFPADESGEILSWTEMGVVEGHDHVNALRCINVEILGPPS
jgi:hypothetical protein